MGANAVIVRRRPNDDGEGGDQLPVAAPSVLISLMADWR